MQPINSQILINVPLPHVRPGLSRSKTIDVFNGTSKTVIYFTFDVPHYKVSVYQFNKLVVVVELKHWFILINITLQQNSAADLYKINITSMSMITASHLYVYDNSFTSLCL